MNKSINWLDVNFAALIACICVSVSAAPPSTPVKSVTDTYHGITVSDPYRWMEDMKSVEFREWIAVQSAYAREQLDAIPGRSGLTARLGELAQSSANATDIAWGGRHLFYLALAPGQNTRQLMWLENGTGPAKSLINPETLSTDGQRLAIAEFTPSPDGRYVAVGLAASGSEKSVLHVFDVRTGTFRDERINYVYGGSWTVVWLDDSRQFFYVRNPEGDRYNKTKVYLHKLGRAIELDPAVFGYGLNPVMPFEPRDYSYFILTPGGKHVVAVTVPGVAVRRYFHTALLADVLAGRAKWRKLASPADQWFRGYVHGQQLYVLSHDAAPRNKVLRIDLDNSQKEPELVVPPRKAVLDDAIAAQDGLYVKGLDAGVAKLFRVSYADNSVREVHLPFPGSIREVTGSANKDGVLVRIEGWTKSQRVLAVDTKGSRDTGLVKPSPADFSQIESRELLVDSYDGIRIPLTVIHRKGLVLDGVRPTILSGYGAYGISSEPRFDPMNLAWLERGGVIAIAHVRGGGEFGEEWHQAGQILTKSNTIQDFVACAEALIKQGYTSAEKLAAVGRSAGGITVGGAITERPELFAAANHAVGVSDLLRTENEGTGPANIVEFGTVKRKYEFLAMHSVSPYHRVVDGTAFPAVIVTTGINDPRVAPWQPGKFAARLQSASSSGKPVLLRTDMDGGHGLGGTRNQRVNEISDVWSFFLATMNEPGFVTQRP